MNLNKGVWFQSTVSGLYYENVESVGNVSLVIVNGEYFYKKQLKERN